MRMNFQDVGLEDKLLIMSNGKEVVDYIDRIFESIADNTEEEETPYQPVSLLLLDINMPIMDGLETLKLVKEKFRKLNET